VVGKQASIDAGGAFARLDEVGIALANSERGEVSIRAGRALLDLAREDVVLEGGVQGTTRAGEHFRTERVRFDRARDELASDGPVELERRGLRVQADGMRLDVEGRRLVLRGSVRTRLEPGGAGG
jgi:LPS export ABC transporter protein LptC